MYNLVICGAHKAGVDSDATMFSDFLGISSTLHLQKSEEVQNTFMSCYPLKDQFEYLATQDPPITEIKWGLEGKPLFTYTKENFDGGDGLLYGHYPATEGLKESVISWIKQKSEEIHPGDVVNIYFQCHRSRDGILLGDKELEDNELVTILGHFKRGVQVNAVTNCHSGKLDNIIRDDSQKERYNKASATHSVGNRIRNYRSSQPFVQSLARVCLPGVPQISSNTITDEELMYEARKDGPTDNTDQMTYLEDLILRDYADVILETENITRRRRIEWPIRKDLFNRSSANTSKATHDKAKTLILDAVNLIHPDIWHFHDMSIRDNIFELQTPNYDRTLRIMYWRGRQQSAIWDLFMILVQRGFLSMDSLIAPMKFRDTSTEISLVLEMLHCFEYCYADFKGRVFGADFLWEGASEWLAVTIVRSGRHPGRMFETIAHTGILGRLDTVRFESIFSSHYYSSFPYDEGNMKGEEYPYFAFWLPHGIGEDSDKWADSIRDSIKKFNRVERVYKDYFQVQDGRLITEDMQESYLCGFS